MASRVDFYVLDSSGDRARLVYACRLVEKVFLLGQRVYVHTDSRAAAEEFDELLWTFADRSFVPHELVGAAAPTTSVLIGFGEAPEAEVLVNLAPAPPAFFARYARVADLVDAHAERRESGRRRFAWYREQGVRPDTHNVTA